jgi:hypothetical protein
MALPKKRRMQDQLTIQLAKQLKDPKNGLERVDLRFSDITAVGAVALAEALKVNSHLVSLDLRHNAIGNEGLVGVRPPTPAFDPYLYPLTNPF